jgi:nicotinate dehydrogenase subunit B
VSDPQPPQPVDRAGGQTPPSRHQRIVRTYGWPVPATSADVVRAGVDAAPNRPAAPLVHVTIDARLDERGGLVAYALTHEPPLLPGAWAPPYAVAPVETADLPPATAMAVAVPASARGAVVDFAANAALGDAARVFAVECHADELAEALCVDPVQWRLSHLTDPRAADLVRRTAERAAWAPRIVDPARAAVIGLCPGRGFALARVFDDATEPALCGWSTWVADVEVDTHSGDVTVTRVVVGFDDGGPARVTAPVFVPVALEVAPAHAEILRLTTERRVDVFSPLPVVVPAVEFLGALELGAAGIGAAGIRAAGTGAAGTGATALLPAAAAIANAIFDATGVRLREPPFSPERLRHALDAARAPRRETRRWPAGVLAGVLAGLGGVLAAMLPWRAAIAPVTPPDPGYFSAAAVERGRLVSAAGDCAVCHTAPGGAPYAGGLALETPFGAVISTNITPDPQTGIGAWSYAAFERAMRAGIHRDGRHLYPVFPYTAYAKTSDGDLLALYAYLMSQAPVRSTPPRTRLAFPFGFRPLLAAWNLMFHRARAFEPDLLRSAAWNRGAYLVEGLGHCGGCHSPRNALGAERGGSLHLAGGIVDGWDAPALTAASAAPLPWTAGHFYDYLRTGHSPAHGAAAGPMAAVVRELQALPDEDLRAMATYLAALTPATPARPAVPVTATVAASRNEAGVDRRAHATPAGSSASSALGARIYAGACAVCHEPAQGPPGYGIKLALATTTSLHAASPNNLLRLVLEGVAEPPTPELGYMPAFHDTLDDAQLVSLTGYLRARFAPEQPAWGDLGATISRLRSRSAAP